MLLYLHIFLHLLQQLVHYLIILKLAANVTLVVHMTQFLDILQFKLQATLDTVLEVFPLLLLDHFGELLLNLL